MLLRTHHSKKLLLEQVKKININDTMLAVDVDFGCTWMVFESEFKIKAPVTQEDAMNRYQAHKNLLRFDKEMHDCTFGRLKDCPIRMLYIKQKPGSSDSFHIVSFFINHILPAVCYIPYLCGSQPNFAGMVNKHAISRIHPGSEFTPPAFMTRAIDAFVINEDPYDLYSRVCLDVASHGSDPLKGVPRETNWGIWTYHEQVPKNKKKVSINLESKLDDLDNGFITPARVPPPIDVPDAPPRQRTGKPAGPERKLSPRNLLGTLKDINTDKTYTDLTEEESKLVDNGEKVVDAESGRLRHFEYTKNVTRFPGMENSQDRNKAFDFVFLFQMGFDIELFLLCRGSETELKPCEANPKPECGIFVRARLKTLPSPDNPHGTVYVEWIDRWTGETWLPSADRNPAYDEVNLREELFGWRVREPFQDHKLEAARDSAFESVCVLHFLTSYDEKAEKKRPKDVLQSAYPPYGKFKLLKDSQMPRNSHKNSLSCSKKEYAERLRFALENSGNACKRYNGAPPIDNYAIILQCTRCHRAQRRNRGKCGTCGFVRSFKLSLVSSFRLCEEDTRRAIEVHREDEHTGVYDYTKVYAPHMVLQLAKPFKGAEYVVVCVVKPEQLIVFGVCSENKTRASFVIGKGELPKICDLAAGGKWKSPDNKHQCSNYRVCGCSYTEHQLIKRGRVECAVGRWTPCPDFMCCGCVLTQAQANASKNEKEQEEETKKSLLTSTLDILMDTSSSESQEETDEEKCNAFIQQEEHKAHGKCPGYQVLLSQLSLNSVKKKSPKRKSPEVIDLSEEPPAKRASTVFVPETPKASAAPPPFRIGPVVIAEKEPKSGFKIKNISFDVIGTRQTGFKCVTIHVPVKSRLEQAVRTSCFFLFSSTDDCHHYTFLHPDTHNPLFQSDWKYITASGTKAPPTLILHRLTGKDKEEADAKERRDNAATPPLAQDSQATPRVFTIWCRFVNRSTGITSSSAIALDVGTSLQRAEHISRAHWGVDGPIYRAYNLYDVKDQEFLTAYSWFKLTSGATKSPTQQHPLELREYSAETPPSSSSASQMERSDSEIILEQLA